MSSLINASGGAGGVNLSDLTDGERFMIGLLDCPVLLSNSASSSTTVYAGWGFGVSDISDTSNIFNNVVSSYDFSNLKTVAFSTLKSSDSSTSYLAVKIDFLTSKEGYAPNGSSSWCQGVGNYTINLSSPGDSKWKTAWIQVTNNTNRSTPTSAKYAIIKFTSFTTLDGKLHYTSNWNY